MDNLASVFSNEWFKVGLGLMIIFPVIAIVLNEIIYRVNSNNDTLVKPIKTIRNIILPLVAVILVSSYLLDIDQSSTFLKIIETLTWIIVINAAMAIINQLLFTGTNGIFKGKAPQLFLDIFRVMMVLFGTAIILSSVWGQNLGSMVTALGLGSFVLGLALQDTLGNLFSGIALVYEKPFEEGDYIGVGDAEGQVIEMNWRAIRLETREKELIVIPHLVIGQGTIKNYSKPQKPVILKKMVRFDYNHPPNKIKQVLGEVCNSIPSILKNPHPEIKVDSYADSYIEYEVEFAIMNYIEHEEILDDFMTRVWYASKRNNLNIPLPQMILHQPVNQVAATEERILNLQHSVEEISKYLPISRSLVTEVNKGIKDEWFGSGETIIDLGEETGNLYVILEGEARIIGLSEKGEEQDLQVVSKGDFFGEISMFTGNKSNFRVKAETDLKVLRIMPEEVLDLVQRNPKFAYYLDEVMDQRREALN